MNHLSKSILLIILALFLLSALGCTASKANRPKLLNWKIENSHPYVLAGDDSEIMVGIDVYAELPSTKEIRIPLNIGLVIDHSGSMRGEEMDDALNATLFMLSELHPDDTVSIVAFSTKAELLLSQTQWEDVNQDELKEKLSDLKPRGTTSMFEALQMSFGQVTSTYDQSRINRIILLSDGIPNNPAPIPGLAQQARNSNVSITTMGLGPFYNEDLMVQLADMSGGNYRFIKNSDEIEAYFLAEKQSMEQVIGRNASITIHLGPGIEVVEAYGGSLSRSGNEVTLFLGEIGLISHRQAGIKLQVTGPASGSPIEVADVQLQWEDVVDWSGYSERWEYIESESTQDQSLIDNTMNATVIEQLSRLQVAVEMDRAIRMYENGQVNEARDQIEETSKKYKQQNVALQQQPSAPPVDEELMQYLDSTVQSLESNSPESDEGKILIKEVKVNSRSMYGQ